MTSGGRRALPGEKIQPSVTKPLAERNGDTILRVTTRQTRTTKGVPHTMRRVIVAFFALVIALVSIGASQKDTGAKQTDNLPAKTVEVSRVTPSLAPTAKPEEVLPQPQVQAPAQASPAAYQLNWYSINGGGATNASSTNYKMGLSVGQPVAGAASGTNYDVGIGFWYGAAAGAGCPIVVSGDVNTPARSLQPTSSCSSTSCSRVAPPRNPAPPTAM